MYHLFCIYIIVTIIINNNNNVSPLALLLSCLYLNPRVFTFSYSPPHPMEGEGESEQAAVWCLVAGWCKTVTVLFGAQHGTRSVEMTDLTELC